MKLCDYYGCEQVVNECEEGFLFCTAHQAYLLKLIDYDDDLLHVVSYCLSALNSKAYNNSVRLL